MSSEKLSARNTEGTGSAAQGHLTQPVTTGDTVEDGLTSTFIPNQLITQNSAPAGPVDPISPSTLSLPTLQAGSAAKGSQVKPLSAQKKPNMLNKKSASAGSAGNGVKKKNKNNLVKQNQTYSDSDDNMDETLDGLSPLDQTGATMPSGSQQGRGAGGKEGRRRKEGGVWEVLEGLRTGQQYNEIPNRFSGMMMKTRKWPMKGWHKRFFVLENGILCYAKSMADIQRGKLHGTIDVGMSVVTCESVSHRIDVDTDDIIYHLKTKSLGEFDGWVTQLRQHRLYRQHEVSVSGGLSRDPHMTFNCHSVLNRALSAPHDDVDYSRILSAPKLDQTKLDLESIESQLLGLSEQLALLESLAGVYSSSAVASRQQSSVSSQLSSESNAAAASNTATPDVFNAAANAATGAAKAAKIDRSYSSGSLLSNLDPGMTGGSTTTETSSKKDKSSFLNKRNTSIRNLSGKKKTKDSVDLTGNGMLSAPLGAGVHLSSSNPDLTAAVNKSLASVSLSEDEKSSTSVSDQRQAYTQLYSNTKSVHQQLMSVAEVINQERTRLAKLIETEKSNLHNASSSYVQSLKSTLTEVLKQNGDLRNRLSQIHNDSAISDLKPVTLQTYMVSMKHSTGPVAPPRRHLRSRAGSIGSISQTTEFHDAAECLSSGSSYVSENSTESADLSKTNEEVHKASESNLKNDIKILFTELSSMDEEDDDDGSDIEENNNQSICDKPIPEAAINLERFSTRRRSKLPSVKVECDVGLFSLLRKNIGKDLSKISMPVSLNEPLNALQRLCEEMEYSELLDRATAADDAYQRIVLITTFCVSAYASTSSRSGTKPFNPLLGETYECVREDKGWKFLAEQVSHHPPVSSCHCISDNFILWQDAQAKTKFWGKSLEISPIGKVNLRLIKHAELYSWNKATSCVHNILGGGQRYVDHYGEVTITNHTLNITCKLTFAKAGYWSSEKNIIYATVFNSKGKPMGQLSGRWDEEVYCGESSAAKCLWRPGAMPANSELYYGFTRFALELNEIDPTQESKYPCTDTRFRPDQRLLEEGRMEEAEEKKKVVEQLQRDRKNKGELIEPKWFTQTSEKEWTYKFNDLYWTKRENPGFNKLDLPKLW